MTSASDVKLWPAMSFRDCDAMMSWLSAIGFTEHATYRDERGEVVHAEWLWPYGGGIMFGADTNGIVHNAGGSAAYLICDDPDAHFDKAVAAGAAVVREMADQDYGGRGGSVTDPEGNQWSFGSYQPS
ncbi:VOC family protein [Nocardioides caldifontis]|uniref:VOC family protein n=1 Tax=Nocardioides caldifontis TaxID=2588938 RepID=UPI0011DF47FF|nr:VOC family protein [Nocardioides caldifontis]